MSEKEFVSYQLNEPPQRDPIDILAWQYHEICEENDRKTCSKIVYGSAVPVTPGEFRAVQESARRTLDFLSREAAKIGRTPDELREAIRRAARPFQKQLAESVAP